jgi:hypothetical protein
MKRYHLTIIAGDRCWTARVEAEGFHSTTSSSASSEYYSFYKNGELVACYPIGRTIIEKIEKIETT